MPNEDVMAVDERLSRLEKRCRGFYGNNQSFTALDGRFTTLDGKVTTLGGRMGRLEDHMSALENKLDVFAESRADIKTVLDAVVAAR